MFMHQVRMYSYFERWGG